MTEHTCSTHSLARFSKTLSSNNNINNTTPNLSLPLQKSTKTLVQNNKTVFKDYKNISKEKDKLVEIPVITNISTDFKRKTLEISDKKTLKKRKQRK